ncbi:hypothetical protein KSP39_PZI012688 [Platanthera zijinensis]|uniref:PDZ domain-containing protein n=1 Tax=Platanthera zijinensis TaxID=2320716 RepID=A0AAP0BFT8_9ASPA
MNTSGQCQGDFIAGQCYAVESGGNAAKAGLKSGDQVVYTSSFFGDELWPADKLGFTKTAIQAKPDSVYFVVSRVAGEESLTPKSLRRHSSHVCSDTTTVIKRYSVSADERATIDYFLPR